MIAVFYDNKFKYLCGNNDKDIVKINFEMFGMSKEMIRIFRFDNDFYFKSLFNKDMKNIVGNIINNTCEIKEIVKFKKEYSYDEKISPCVLCNRDEINELDFYTQDEIDLYISEKKLFFDWIASNPSDESEKPDQTSPYWNEDNLKINVVTVPEVKEYGAIILNGLEITPMVIK